MVCFDPVISGHFSGQCRPGSGVNFSNHLYLILFVLQKLEELLNFRVDTMQGSSI